MINCYIPDRYVIVHKQGQRTTCKLSHSDYMDGNVGILAGEEYKHTSIKNICTEQYITK